MVRRGSGAEVRRRDPSTHGVWFLFRRDAESNTWWQTVTVSGLTTGNHTMTTTTTSAAEAPWNYPQVYTVYIETTTILDIDMKPGRCKNPINLKSKGVIPVAVLGSADFDVRDIDVDTVAFGAGEASEAHGKAHYEDVNDDGHEDLVLHFKTQDSGIESGDTEVTLTATLENGGAAEGSDSVSVKKPRAESASEDAAGSRGRPRGPVRFGAGSTRGRFHSGPVRFRSPRTAGGRG